MQFDKACFLLLFTITQAVNLCTQTNVYVQTHFVLVRKPFIFLASNIVCSGNKNDSYKFFLQLQVASDGVVSFGRTFPLIAPFWSFSFVTFRNIFYRETSNVTLLQRARHQLRELFQSFGNFTPTTLFIATWDRVARGGESQVSTYITANNLM